MNDNVKFATYLKEASVRGYIAYRKISDDKKQFRMIKSSFENVKSSVLLYGFVASGINRIQKSYSATFLYFTNCCIDGLRKDNLLRTSRELSFDTNT